MQLRRLGCWTASSAAAAARRRSSAGQARLQTNGSPLARCFPRQDGRTESLGGSKKLAAVAGNVQELRLLL